IIAMGRADDEEDPIRRSGLAACVDDVLPVRTPHGRLVRKRDGRDYATAWIDRRSRLGYCPSPPVKDPAPYAPAFRKNFRRHRASDRRGLRAVAAVHHLLRDRAGGPEARADRRRGAWRRRPGLDRGTLRGPLHSLTRQITASWYLRVYLMPSECCPGSAEEPGAWTIASLAARASRFRASVSAP